MKDKLLRKKDKETKGTYKLQYVVCVHLLFHNLCVTELGGGRTNLYEQIQVYIGIFPPQMRVQPVR